MLTWQNTGDPCTPETVTFVNHLMPTRVGFTTALWPEILGAAAGTNTTVNVPAATPVFRSTGYAYFDSTQAQKAVFSINKKLYRFPGNADISRGVAYTGDYFCFAQWRDRIYAANGADVLQNATTGSFADVSATAPKFTRIAVAGEFLAGIGLVADYVGSLATVTASPYMLMISGVGNPDQFDVDIDTSAFYQDIYDSGGPLTAIARLRDFFVVFQKSGVYVVENVGGDLKWSIRCVTDYFGCAHPDSVIEVNNVLYWISPTNGGEVCAFDGAQVTPLSSALNGIGLNGTGNDNYGFVDATSTVTTRCITAATNGETIIWNSFYTTNGSVTDDTVFSEQLYLNIDTGRFGFSSLLGGDSTIAPFCVFSNAVQSDLLAIKVNTRTAFPFSGNLAVAAMRPYSSASITPEFSFYRGSEQPVSIVNATPRFSEYPENNAITNGLVALQAGDPNLAVPTYATSTPAFSWMSTQRTGDSTYTAEAAATVPTASWNSTTGAFDIASSTVRSKTAKTFAFKVALAPVNSITGITIDTAPAGTGQTGAKAVKWQ